jgi:hypothetical protein
MNFIPPPGYALRSRISDTYSRVLSVSATLLLLASGPAWGTTVSEILKDPTGYSGKHLDVSGTVQDVEQKTSRRGNDYETFDVCDGDSCVKVFAWGHPQINEGQKLTVHGTFDAVKHVGRYTFYNELDADEGSLR